MGQAACLSKKKNYKQQATSQFNDQEVELLLKVFKDLASRNTELTIKKVQFLKVFSFTGLWGVKLFDDFDTLKQGQLDFNQFLDGIAKCIKIPQKDKIKHLFELYDLGKDGFIDKNDFRTMLYNYPKDKLKKLLNDKDFLEKAKILQKIDNQKLILEPQQDEQKENKGMIINIQNKKESNLMRVNSLKVNNQAEECLRKSYSQSKKELEQNSMMSIPEERMHNQEELQMSGRRSQKGNIKSQRQSVDYKSMFNSSTGNSGGMRQMTDEVNNNTTFSINSQITFNINNQDYPMKRANISKLVNKFVNYTFKNYPNSNEQFDFSQFQRVIGEHISLLTLFENTFHEDVWGYSDRRVPNYKSKDILQRGWLYKRGKGNKVIKQWFELREFFLFKFNDQKSRSPKAIICLEGLQATKLAQEQGEQNGDDTFRNGFEIYHRDKIYKVKKYYCKDYLEFSQWMDCFKQYDRSDPFQLYEVRDKIGTGGFSVVYRAID